MLITIAIYLAIGVYILAVAIGLSRYVYRTVRDSIDRWVSETQYLLKFPHIQTANEARKEKDIGQLLLVSVLVMYVIPTAIFIVAKILG